MKLTDLLEQKRDNIIARWLDSVLAAYPADTSKHLKESSDQFDNPVGHTFRNQLPVLWAALVGDADKAALARAVEDIVKIRTVQAASPSQAVLFVFLVKNVVREELREHLTDSAIGRELREFESKVDGLALVVFDQYLSCKEKIYAIGVQEAKMRSVKLVEQVNKIYGGLNRPVAGNEGEVKDASNT